MVFLASSPRVGIEVRGKVEGSVPSESSCVVCRVVGNRELEGVMGEKDRRGKHLLIWGAKGGRGGPG